MTKLQPPVSCLRGPRGSIVAAICSGLMLSLAPTLRATITWSSGTNTVGADQTLQDTQIVITGGTNTVQGKAGPPPGATSGGTLRLIGGGVGLQFTGASVTLNSDSSSSGRLLIQGNVSTSASSATATISSGGAASLPGNVDLGSGTRVFTVAAGSVPAGGPDLAISSTVSNGGVEKAGPGIIALSGNNTYAGGTMLDAGTFYVNSATAIGTGFFTVAGANTTIDNRSGGPLTLTNNNQFNLTSGDFNFTGTYDLNLGTGIFVMTNASRTVNVGNANATLIIGGRIQDAGQNLNLTKSGPGTLVLNGDNLFGGTTTVSGGSLVLNGSTLHGATVLANASLIDNGSLGGDAFVSGTLSGNGAIHGSLVVNGGTVDLSAGTLTVDGGITNNGLFILAKGAQVTGYTGFVNNGTLDITTGSLPANLTNNGTIIDSSVVKAKSVSSGGTTITLTIDSYTGHTYQLQKSTTPDASSFTVNIGSSQQGQTGTILTFTDPNVDSAHFYRIAVDP